MDWATIEDGQPAYGGQQFDSKINYTIAGTDPFLCRFLEREGGHINVMKLVKLVYLLDRLSVARRGIPVVGGVYYSMRNGPVTSELLDLANSGCLWGEAECRWEEFLSDRKDHEIGLLMTPAYEHLSEFELKLIDEIYLQHGGKDQWQLRDWCHEHCGEWTPHEQGRERIDLAELAANVGRSEEEVKRIEEEAAESNMLATFLARR